MRLDTASAGLFWRMGRLIAVCSSILVIGIMLGASLRITTPASADFGACTMFSADNIWNSRVDGLPVHPLSSAFVNSIGANKPLHPDFGSGQWDGFDIGMAAASVPGSQQKVAIKFDYADQSDGGPYPIPSPPPIEGGNYVTNTGDRHMLIVDTSNCTLYETWNSWKQSDGSWSAGSGALFALSSNALRPAGWTSADAAGLPILPGLARYDEVSNGAIRHALRFTVHCSQDHIWPGRHTASSGSCTTPPPMGLRFRLKAAYAIAPGLNPQVKVILTALQQYGMFVADNSSSGDWYISGLHDTNWNDDALVNELQSVKGTDFEAVDESSLMADPDSGQVRLLTKAIWLPILMR